MPILDSSFIPQFAFSNSYIQTVLPVLLRPQADVNFQRERLELADGDFLDLDWIEKQNSKLVILLHGMEGHSKRKYMMGMAQAFSNSGWDALAMNLRGCSGEPNRLPKAYYSGCTEDLDAVVKHVQYRKAYTHICLLGFSLGGNVVLKYLGESHRTFDSAIRAGIGISVPCDLAGASQALSKLKNRIYLKRFLNEFHQKIKAKSIRFSDQISADNFSEIRNLEDFDDRYTAPQWGYRNAQHYWAECSSAPLLKSIRIPTLILNARNDSFLSLSCYPVEAARLNPNLFLEIPDSGGHVGFMEQVFSDRYWSEKRALEFVQFSESG